MTTMAAMGREDGAFLQAEAARWARRIEGELSDLRRYALRLARNRDDADDLVQDCVAIALRARGGWRGEGPLRAWLFAILRNEHRRQIRRGARWRFIDIDAVSVEAENAAGESRAVDSVDPLLLSAAASGLRRLPASQREVVLLVAVQGRSYAEAAERLGLPVGTVMSRLHRARERLRGFLEERGAKTAVGST